MNVIEKELLVGFGGKFLGERKFFSKEEDVILNVYDDFIKFSD